MEPITLFQPPTRPWGIPNLAPFCTKLETYLRMTAVPYRTAAADVWKAPKGKIPFVTMDGTSPDGTKRWRGALSLTNSYSG
jgi:hypothetical protein